MNNFLLVFCAVWLVMFTDCFNVQNFKIGRSLAFKKERFQLASSNPNSPEEADQRSNRIRSASDNLKNKEEFVTRATGRFECQSCGYVYDEQKGAASKGIAAGTPFALLEEFRCPQCGAGKKYFVEETETVSGFKENQKFGLGANSLTGDQKGLLIFGGLLAGVVLFLSGYLLE